MIFFFKPYLILCCDADALWFAEGTKILIESLGKRSAWVGVCTRDRENSARVSVGKLGPRSCRECVGQTEAHLSWGALLTQLPPRCHGSPSCTGSSVRKGKSLPESRSCRSLVGCRLLSVCHPLGQSCQGWGQDLATSKPCCHGQCGSAVASEAWTISSSLCPICAHGIAGRGTAKLSVQFSPLRLPAPRQMCVFRSHELSRLGTSCNLAETSKEYPDVAGSSVRWGQPRTNSVLVRAMVLLACRLPKRKPLLISWWLVATRTSRTFHSQLLQSECHWLSPLLIHLIFCCDLN